MAVGDVWVLHGVQTPTNFYSVVNDATPAPVIDALILFASGHHEPLFTAVRGARPEVAFTALEVGLAAAEFGIDGADLSSGNTDLYYRKVTDLGTREAAATTTHLRLRMANAFGYIESIRSAQGQESTVSIRLCPTFDGTNEPIVPAGSQALSGTPAVAEAFGLGPTALNSTDLAGVQSVDVDLAPDVMVLGDDGEIFPSFCAIRTITPVVMIRGFDAGWWADYGLDGTAMTDLVTYCRHKAKDGGNTADATESHLKITSGDGLITLENTTGGGNSETQTGLRVQCRAASSSAASVTMTASSAIT